MVEFATWGLVANLIGVVMLFYFGMPFHVPQGGSIFLALEQRDENGLRKERFFQVMGFVGLALIFFGTVLQIAAVRGWWA
ncbi:MAG: hypothetical protein ABL864_06985 [Terricaulis sp.]